MQLTDEQLMQMDNDLAAFSQMDNDLAGFEMDNANQKALQNAKPLAEGDPAISDNINQTEKLANLLFTPYELELMDKQGSMGWVEYRTKYVTPKDYLPGGVFKQGYDAGRMLSISKKLENNEDVSQDDKLFMYTELRKEVEKSRRGLKTGANAAAMFIQAPAFIAEFALSGGLGAVAFKGAAKGAIKGAGVTATKFAIKAGAKKALKETGEKIGTSAALKISTDVTARIAGRGAVLIPAYAYENYGERRIADGLKMTDKGEVFFSEEKGGEALTALKAIGTGAIQVGTEMVGGVVMEGVGKILSKAGATNIGRGIGAVTASVYNKIPKTSRVKLEAIGRVASEIMSPTQAVAGVHGVAGEMSEELASRLLMSAFDLDETKGYSTDEFLEAIYPGHEQFLLELGLFSVLGAVSFAGQTVYKDFKSKGYSEIEARQIIENLSENELEAKANELLGEVPVNQDISENEIQEEVKQLKLKFESPVFTDTVQETDTEKEASPVTVKIPEIEVVEETASGQVKESIKTRFENWYSDWVNSLRAIEQLEQKALEKTDLKPSERPNLLARTYKGIVGAIKTNIEKNTTVLNADGNIEITGEGLKPILNDYALTVKEIEPNKVKAEDDLQDYLIARRYLEDLAQREDVEVTEEQKLNSVETIARLNAKYGDIFDKFNDFAGRLYDFQKRILQNLVASGNLSQEQFDNIIEKNPHYIPFNRILDEESPTAPVGKNIPKTKAKIRKIKGSEREIQKPFQNIIKNAFTVLDTAYKNRIIKSIARLKEFLPEYIQDKKPLYEKGKATFKIAFDSKLRSKLEKAIEFFGGNIEHKKTLNKAGTKGLILGDYNEQEKLVRKRLGAQDRTLAHEFGHMLDYIFSIKDKINADTKLKKEVENLAQDRFVSYIELSEDESGDVVFTETKKKANEGYIKSDREIIANMFDMYFTSRNYMKETAPKAYKFVNDLFSQKEMEFLKDIQPSAESKVEEIEQDVWVKSRQMPYGNVLEYFENGQRKFIEVDKNIYKALTEMETPQLDFIYKFFQGSASLLRRGATIMPDFWLRNVLRDQYTAFIQTDSKFIPVIDTVRGIFNILGNTKLYQEWVSSGGTFNSYMQLNDKSMEQAYKELISGDIFKKLNIVAHLENLSSLFEQGTRLGVYAKARLESSPLEAAYESREATLDFGRAGFKGRWLNKFLPFFNAGIQGVDKMVRAFKKNPKAVTMKCLATITLPSLIQSAYYLYMSPDDERKEYLEIPQWQKNLFWCFKIGDTWFRWPKPFTFGYLFGSVPERAMEWLYRGEKPEGREIRDIVFSLGNSITPVNDIGGLVPPVVRLCVEWQTNWSFFRGEKIFPAYLEDLEPREQKTRSTPEIAVELGKILNVSPAQIENVIRGQIGTSANYIFDAGDKILNGVRKFNGEDINERPYSLSDIPVLRSFVIREPIGYQTVSTNKFFEDYDELSKIRNTYKNLDGEEKLKYFDKQRDKINAYYTMNTYRKRIRSLSKYANNIYESKTLTGKEKTESLRPILKQVSDTAFEANVWYKEYMKGR